MKKKIMKKLLKWVTIMIPAGNLLDYACFKKKLRTNCNWPSKKTKLKDPQQINFIGKLSKNTEATVFFIIEKSEETTFNFSQNSVAII